MLAVTLNLLILIYLHISALLLHASFHRIFHYNHRVIDYSTQLRSTCCIAYCTVPLPNNYSSIQLPICQTKTKSSPNTGGGDSVVGDV